MTKLTMLVASMAGASAIALGGYWLGQARGSRAASPSRSLQAADNVEQTDHDAKLAATIGMLERRIATMEMRPAVTTPSEAAAPASPPAAAEPERFNPAKEEEKRLQSVAAIEAALRTEPRDRSWASPTEGTLRAAVDAVVNEGAKFSVKDLKCLTSVCEMVLSASAADDLKYLADQLAPRITGMSSLDLSPPTTGADGSATVTCRLFRLGYPRPDQGLL
jgi:hypothetical protein